MLLNSAPINAEVINGSSVAVYPLPVIPQAFLAYIPTLNASSLNLPRMHKRDLAIPTLNTAPLTLPKMNKRNLTICENFSIIESRL